MADETFARAREFLYANGRLLEQRLFASHFERGPGAAVIDALRGYQNDDGGFGHGLEPDKRCPASLPGDVEVALRAMAAAGLSEDEMVGRACDYLASVADERGAVPLAFPVVERYPHAEHWVGWTYEPGLFPTAGLVGLLRELGHDHPWLEQATRFCWSALDQGLPAEAHVLGEILVFCASADDRERARAVAEQAVEALPTASMYRADPDGQAYGVTPLHLAPAPESPWRPLFADRLIEAHLERLHRDQQDDGAWPLTWHPPSPAAVLEWRGIETLRALTTLSAYGVIPGGG